MKSTIMEDFPKQHEPRLEQEKALREFEIKYPHYDVFVINAPTATGKTDMDVTIARHIHKKYNHKSTIITPTKVLVKQLIDEFPRMATLKSKADYNCKSATTEIGPKGGETVKPCGACAVCKQRLKDNRRIRVMPYSVVNYWIYYSYKLYNNTLIADESHNILELLKDIGAKKFWQSQEGFPEDVETYGDVLGWAEAEMEYRPTKKLKTLISELKTHQPSTTLQVTYEKRYGTPEHCMKLLPLDARHMPPTMWPHNKVKKIVLLSATIGPQDIYDLGLDGRRVCYINCDSPIPPKNRPVLYTPIGDMSRAHQKESIPLIAKEISRLEGVEDGKGLIHCTYAVARELRTLLKGRRYLFHTKQNKDRQYETFLKSDNGIFIASGMHEGIDLVGSSGRWQVITQVPYPSLADPAVSTRLETDPDWYAWSSIKALLQASGRICRTPTDYGKTIILDNQFKRLYTKNKDMFPQWYKDAVRGI